MPRGKGKLERWAQNKAFDCVHEPDLRAIARGEESPMRGRWRERALPGGGPITLELGCGQGLFTVDLAERHPERSFVGIDVKGHRFWRGAKQVETRGIPNAAFLRARVQWLDAFFAPGEVDRIWLTFTDPQVGDKRGTKRLTSPYYLRLYQAVLRMGGTVAVKTDSPEFHERTLEDAPLAGMEVVDSEGNVHGAPAGRFREDLARSLAFITAYEEMWLKEGRRVRYCELKKVREVPDELATEAKAMLQGPPDRDRPRYHGAGSEGS